MDDDPDTSGDEFERTSLDEATPYSAPFTPDARTPHTRRRVMGLDGWNRAARRAGSRTLS